MRIRESDQIFFPPNFMVCQRKSAGAFLTQIDVFLFNANCRELTVNYSLTQLSEV